MYCVRSTIYCCYAPTQDQSKAQKLQTQVTEIQSSLDTLTRTMESAREDVRAAETEVGVRCTHTHTHTHTHTQTTGRTMAARWGALPPLCQGAKTRWAVVLLNLLPLPSYFPTYANADSH